MYMDEMRNSLGEMLGNYISICGDDAKFRILEFCKLSVIFENKIFNQSFLQEILNKGKMNLYQTELSRYMS